MKKLISILLVMAMIFGRIVWGIVKGALLGLSGNAFGWTAFLSGAIINSIPGIALQIVLVPIIVISLNKYTKKSQYKNIH